MNINNTCILLVVFVLALFQVVQASSFNDKTLPSFKFVKHLLNSKKVDKVKALVEMRNYLFKYGYYSPSKVVRGTSCFTSLDYKFFDQVLGKEIKKFQLFFHLNVSGILDEKTMSLMVKPRSGNPDLVNQNLIKLHWVKLVHNSFKSGSYYVLGDTTWTTTNLTWALEPGIRSDAINPIKCAFQSWEVATKFKFEKIDNYTKANVKISFTPINQLREFLEYPKSVALSSYPPDGLLHFRADVPWVNGAQRGKMDIETVAVHELGHILGLEHSDVPSAVMYPTTKWGVIKRNLHKDDIAGIKEMYNFP